MQPGLPNVPAGLLELDGLDVDFQSGSTEVRAVDQVDLRIEPGETIALVGESGSGKSVTSLALMGLLGPNGRSEARRARFRPEVSLPPIDLFALSARERRKLRGRDMAMIFQEPMTSLNPLHTIGDQIGEPLRIHMGASLRETRDRAIELLTQVGIPDPARRLSAYPHELSGGMRQRVMIAMAMVCNPALLIADEPTTALDVTIQAQILALFRRLRDQYRQAMLFITHDLGVVAEIANRVYVMYAGQVVESGPVAAILTRPRHPYTRGLLASLPRIDRPISRRESFYAIVGQSPDLRQLPPGCRFQTRCSHFRQGLCDAVPPDLVPVEAGHDARCARLKELEDLDVA